MNKFAIMFKIFPFVFLLLICVVFGYANASEWIVNPSNGHLYKIIEADTWWDCENQAVNEGAHLVTITNEDENNWLLQTFGSQELYYIGFTDKDQEGNWVWISGEPVSYTYWCPSEPNDTNGNEDYAIMCNGSLQCWNDGSGIDLFKAIIEKNEGTEPGCDLQPILNVLTELNNKIDNLEAKLNDIKSKVETGAVIKTKDLNKGVYFMGAKKKVQ